MKIKIIKDSQHLKTGNVHEVSKDIADNLVANGHAEIIEEDEVKPDNIDGVRSLVPEEPVNETGEEVHEVSKGATKEVKKAGRKTNA